MSFKKYSSIENSYRKKFTDQALLYYPDMIFAISEKLHGSNFSFTADEKGRYGITCGKKSTFLSEIDKFFNFQQVRDKYKDRVLAVFEHIKSTKEDVQQISIHGEIFGGKYPHPDVPEVNNQSKVQKGIWYTPENDFYGFDIRVNYKWLPKIESDEIFEKFGFLYNENLFNGALKECLEYPNKFQTTIPAKLGLPEIEDNFCEGVVIVPYKQVVNIGVQRLILKNKHEKEVQGKKKDKSNRMQSQQKEVEHLKEHFDNIECFVTENRLRNVISHIGQITNKDFGKLAGAFSKDIIEDFVKDNDSFIALSKKDQKYVTKYANNRACSMIKSNILNIIDGEF
jgi:Rnl2 family RNA ligase